MGDTLTKAEIWDIKNDIQEAIRLISECVDHDRNTFWYHGFPCFNELDERVKLLKEHVINAGDCELAKQIASYERIMFSVCANKWYLSEEYRAGYAMLINTGIWMYDIYKWLVTEYYKIPYEDVDKYYMKGCRLYDGETNQEYTYTIEMGDNVETANKQNIDIEPQQKNDITENRDMPNEPRNNKSATDELHLPSELDTEQARKYFVKAINVGYMRKEGNGYKWLFGDNKGQARLGYFCNKIFTPPRPINKLEQIFGVKKLSASISNAEIEAGRADVKKWRNEIDNNIFND